MPSKSPTKHRSPDNRLLWIVIAAAAAARLAMLGLYPLMDTTEARYAEIARRMVELGDWVTPWIHDGVPFWGKPPLSFWMTAASFKVFGVSAFAARLPHWLCGCLLAWLVWSWLARRSRDAAIIAVALITGSALFFVAAGAVMTDMALALGTTLMMRGFWSVLHGAPAERRRGQGMLFLGLAVGLLAKGPIAALLAGLPIAIWTLGAGQTGRVLREVGWVSGLLVTLALVAPWYVWAEWRTPGFLEYFLIGEHWHRFVFPGWQGDLYGHAHNFPRGAVWLFAIVGFLPWSLLVPVAAWRWRHAADSIPSEERSLCGYLLIWALMPCVFFSAAGNTLWTYVLPGLPALAMVTAIWLARMPRLPILNHFLAGGVAFTALAAMGVVLGFNLGGWTERKSTELLVSDYVSHRSVDAALIFFRKRPSSGDFYSRGRAEYARGVDDLQLRLTQEPVFVAIKGKDLDRLPKPLLTQFRLVSRRGDYSLFLAEPKPDDVQSLQSSWGGAHGTQ